MSDELEEQKDNSPAGAPAYMTTFADLMSLLMCFFVLMLSFSEMDVLKFKQLSGSMREAFGVQADIKAKVMPKGTSIITKEFQPGKPQPTPMKTVRQYTINSNKSTLKFVEEHQDEAVKKRKARRDAARIAQALKGEIEQRSVAVDVEGKRIIIRILEKASFASGSAEIKQDFQPVLTKIRGLLATVPGEIMVSGHTDNVPIATSRFRSNWELSASRAVSVTHELLADEVLDDARFVIEGYGDTMPLAANDNPENRARNRRVDISVVRGDDVAGRTIDTTGRATANVAE